ncbi:MAG TPA: hypothetical protein VL242_12575 [Sorangium sp.]|nr:hypothetical protein [Sorangium sp.]
MLLARQRPRDEPSYHTAQPMTDRAQPVTDRAQPVADRAQPVADRMPRAIHPRAVQVAGLQAICPAGRRLSSTAGESLPAAASWW